MDFESTLPYEIVFVRKRSSSATFREGKIMLRISSYLSAPERRKHIQDLLSRLNKKLAKSEPQKQLLDSLFKKSTIHFFDEKYYTFYVAYHARTSIVVTDTTVVIYSRKWPKEPLLLEFALQKEMLSKKDATRAFLQFCEQNYLEKVTKVIKEWYDYICPKKRLGKVDFSSMNSRWGTCSSQGNITIAAKTLLLPEALFESICVHEVAHLDQMNHGKNFWKQVLSVLPNYKELQKELKNFH